MKILSLNGLLGYGYDRESLERAMDMEIDYIGVDAGSTDPGPHYLGTGTSFTNRNAVKRDIELVLPWALKKRIPFIIGTAGGSGAAPHLRWMRKILDEIAEECQLSFQMAVIATEVSKEYVMNKLSAGKVRDLSPDFPISTHSIERCTHIVSQIGITPIIEALRTDADVILCGRCCDTAIYAAPAIMNGMDEGIAVHMA